MNDQSNHGGNKAAEVSDNDAPLSRPSRKNRSRRFRNGIIFIVALATLAGLGNWIYGLWRNVIVYDARIGADVIAVSGRVEGWITKILINEGQRVKTGQALVVIDDREAKLRLEELDAALGALQSERQRNNAEIRMIDQRTRGRVQAAKAALNAAKAAAAVLDSELKQAKSDFVRVQRLLKNKVVARQRWETVRTAYHKTQQHSAQGHADVARADAAILEAEADRQQMDILRLRLVELRYQKSRLQSKRARQALDISDRTIKSPIDGVIDRSFFAAGEFVKPGQRLIMLHNPAEIWVDANVKETDIRNIAIGRRAHIAVDAYPSLNIEGKVVRIGQAATSQFSLLPSPNPSGNFTKITQRLPVRIEIQQVDDLLRPGMMVEVEIAIRGR